MSVNLTISIDEKEIKRRVKEQVLDILQKEISMRWIRQIIEQEIRNKVKNKLNSVFEKENKTR